tara:strand:- start:1259 stop:1588 length:330 start_codon:yes stop_codon:yes gene_type:complete
MQKHEKINYKGWTLKGIEFTPYKKQPFWEVNIYDKYDVPLQHFSNYVDTWTKRKRSDLFTTTFIGWEDAKDFIDSIEAPISEMNSRSDYVKKALSECANKFPKDVDFYI